MYNAVNACVYTYYLQHITIVHICIWWKCPWIIINYISKCTWLWVIALQITFYPWRLLKICFISTESENIFDNINVFGTDTTAGINEQMVSCKIARLHDMAVDQINSSITLKNTCKTFNLCFHSMLTEWARSRSIKCI